jgi:hypothetical protein
LRAPATSFIRTKRSPVSDDLLLGTKHLTRYNTMMFITTKREAFADDREVRAML